MPCCKINIQISKLIRNFWKNGPSALVRLDKVKNGPIFLTFPSIFFVIFRYSVAFGCLSRTALILTARLSYVQMFSVVCNSFQMKACRPDLTSLGCCVPKLPLFRTLLHSLDYCAIKQRGWEKLLTLF